MMIAALKVMADETPLPPTVQHDLRDITGSVHRTYGTAARALMETRFEGSGRYWATFMVGPPGLQSWWDRWRLWRWYLRWRRTLNAAKQ